MRQKVSSQFPWISFHLSNNKSSRNSHSKVFQQCSPKALVPVNSRIWCKITCAWHQFVDEFRPGLNLHLLLSLVPAFMIPNYCTNLATVCTQSVARNKELVVNTGFAAHWLHWRVLRSDSPDTLLSLSFLAKQHQSQPFENKVCLSN